MAVIAVTSGTPGAGKTTVAINLAAALGRLQRRVVLFDATPSSTLAQRLGLSRQPTPAIGPHGVQVVTPHVGGRRQRLTRSEMRELSAFIHALDAETDYVVVDTPTSASVLTGIASSIDDVVLVTAPHLPATDRTVGAIRRLLATRTGADEGIVVNGVSVHDEGERVGRVVAEMASQRLDRSVELYGIVTADPDLARAQMMQRAVVECRPQADSSRCFQALASQVARTGPWGGGGLSRFAPLHPGTAAVSARPMEAQQCA